MVQASVRTGPVEDATLGDVARLLGRSFAVEGVVGGPDGVTATVGDDVSQERLRQAVARALRVARHLTEDEVFRSEPAGWSGHDAQPALEAAGDVQRLGPGLFAFAGGFLRVRGALDGLLLQVAARQGARALSYPPLWPVPVLRDINYFHDFPQLAMVAAGVGGDFAARSRFSEACRKGSGATTIACTAENGLAPAVNALAPTVCDCCYWLLRDRRDVADQALTVHGNAFRNEASESGSLDRLSAFTMREIVTIGSEAFVLARRAALLEELKGLALSLGLRARIAAADDPFFCNDALQKSLMQTAAQLKYELRVTLFGEREIAVGSLNLHNDYFSRSYDYTAADGTRPFSGCFAIGCERLTFALFCRHGSDPARWPGPVRDLLGLA